jgi:hypothetical protein
MADQLERARRGFALSPPGDPLGTSCDESGPSLGPIRLLEKGAFGFWPRPIEDLTAIPSAAFDEPIGCERLVSGLETVARALQAKDMARAIFATQFLRLPEASTDYREFPSYGAFRKMDVKRVYGSAGEGKDWHHIVEQGLKGDTIPQEQLQSTKNIVRIPRIIHELISSESSSATDGSGVRLRDELRGRPFGEKYQAGLNVLKKIGILKD